MKVKAGQHYRHYEGDVCHIISVPTHVINQKSYVVYRSEGDGRVLTMPTKLFQSSVTVKGQKIRRFELIKEER